MKGDDFLELFKWVGLVFAAGFIGYFGKILAKKILYHSKDSDTESPPDSQVEESKYLYKLKKKRLKQKQKEQKKKNK